MFVCDFYNHCIQVFGVDGSFARQWGTIEAAGMAMSELPVAWQLVSNHRIKVFNVAGAFLRQWGTKGSGKGQLNGPGGLVVSGGEVYVYV